MEQALAVQSTISEHQAFNHSNSQAVSAVFSFVLIFCELFFIFNFSSLQRAQVARSHLFISEHAMRSCF
jgi:hypothetical protein